MNNETDNLQRFIRRNEELQQKANTFVAFNREVVELCKKYGFSSYKNYEDSIKAATEEYFIGGRQEPVAFKHHIRRPFITEEKALLMKKLYESNQTHEAIAEQLGVNRLLVQRWQKKGFVWSKPGRVARELVSQ